MRTSWRATWRSNVVVILAALALWGCGSDDAAPASRDAAAGSDAATGADAADTASGADTESPPAEQFTPPTGCNPIAAEWDCFYPFPSDHFRVMGSQGTPRVLLSNEVMAYQSGVDPSPETALDFPSMFAMDGFSNTQQLAVRIPGGVTLTDLVMPYASDVTLTSDLGPSASADHGTLLLDTETGSFVPHYADVDRAPADPNDHLLMIRPAVRLVSGRRYVAALHGLSNPAGAAVVPPASFAALRDNTAGGALQTHMNDKVFAPLVAAGVERASLQLAWDFTVQSEASAKGDLLRVRELALAEFAKAPPAVTIVSVTEDPDAYIARRVEGELTVPLFVEQPTAAVRLVRGPDGRPVQNGTVQVPFTALIPKSVWSGTTPGPARVLQFGHGFFGSRNEITTFPHRLGDQAGMIVVAVDWLGMSSGDAAALAVDLLTTGKMAPRFVERAHQGMVNQLALSEAVANGLFDHPQLQKDGKSLTDGKFIGFYGISQGHILGGTYAALSTRIDHFALEVGGASFGLMMSRAAPFKPFFEMLTGASGTQAGAQKLMLLLMPILDRIDPATWAEHVRDKPLPGSPATRQLLLRDGLADTQVPNIAHHLHVRLLGLPQLTPVARPLWGMTLVDGPQPSGFLEYDFGEKPKDVHGMPAGGNQVHGGLRELPAAMEQIDRFLRPGGLVEWTCDGPCDPE